MKRPPLPEVDARGTHLALGERTYIMGILNVTPDSFSDGGRFFDRGKAIEHALAMVRDGADVIDVGGESTRPGAEGVSEREELDRVIPVIKELRQKTGIVLSVDTRRSNVAQEAVEAGAQIVNDVSGLGYDKDMAAVVADSGAALIVMHMKGTPKDMQSSPGYVDCIGEVMAGLRKSVQIARDAGVKEEKIIIDPGIGFGKMFEHNLQILNRLDEFHAIGRPICVGTSRKAFIGKALGIDDPGQRLSGTIATCVLAIIKGANLLRVHDVRQVRQAAQITDSILRAH